MTEHRLFLRTDGYGTRLIRALPYFFVIAIQYKEKNRVISVGDILFSNNQHKRILGRDILI